MGPRPLCTWKVGPEVIKVKNPRCRDTSWDISEPGKAFFRSCPILSCPIPVQKTGCVNCIPLFSGFRDKTCTCINLWQIWLVWCPYQLSLSQKSSRRIRVAQTGLTRRGGNHLRMSNLALELCIWLPSNFRVDCKIGLIVQKAPRGLAPQLWSQKWVRWWSNNLIW